MNQSRRIDKYLRNYGVRDDRPITVSSIDGIRRSVVIPVFSELSHVFRTLSSISQNPPEDLSTTLVVCVVNNHGPHLSSETDIYDNQRTLKILKLLASGHLPSSVPPEIAPEDLHAIAKSNLRLACIDASSPVLEIPDRDGGVGTARKIGMDAALRLMDGSGACGGVILCLDADTLVEQNYVSAVCNHFEGTRNPGAVVSFAHRMPADLALRNAICNYEIFLRAYVMGLSFAGSPYAFHSIGSAMACTAEGYTSVRGMNRKEAAEDFHFLNKLAKIGTIGAIHETTVFPSPRISHRVPFGTGRQMNLVMTAGQEGCRFHHPDTFLVLKEWLECIAADPDRDPETILTAAGEIHPLLLEFLRMNRFETCWEKIRLNCSDSKHLIKQFHVWFDGLMTLRLIHHLSRSSCFPTVAAIDALAGLFGHMGVAISFVRETSCGVFENDLEIEILNVLRSRLNHAVPTRSS